MNIWDENKIVIFIAFIVPGFVAIKIYELIMPASRVESSKQIIDAVAYSCLNYTLLLWPIYVVETGSFRSEHKNLYILFYVFVLFIFPAILVVVWKWLRETRYLQKLAPHPTQKPWDYVFAKRCCYWVVVTLKNGEKIAGLYGSHSFASSAPAKEQIFLEEEWLLNKDGGFDRKVEQTSGVIIIAQDIISVELFHNGDKDNGKK